MQKTVRMRSFVQSPQRPIGEHLLFERQRLRRAPVTKVNPIGFRVRSNRLDPRIQFLVH
jgi:hypothetical protein